MEAKTLKEIDFTWVLSLVDAGAQCAMVRSRGEKREFGGGLYERERELERELERES